MLRVFNREEETFDIAKLVVVAFVKSVEPVSVVEASEAEVPTVRILPVSPPLKVLSPLKVFTFASSVEEAANSVMSVVPLNDTPLIRRAFWSAVAVPALPLMEPVIRDEKVFDPLKVFAFASSVEEAAVMVMFAVPSKVTPLMVRPVCNAVAVEALPVKVPMMPLTALSCPPMVVDAEVVRLVTLATASVVAPVTFNVPLCTALPVVIVPPTLSAPLMVDEPLTAKLVEVAPWSDVPPSTVSDPLALSAPPMFKRDASVVEPVTAKVPVEVALLNVAPPLNAICVDVALPGKGYANVVAEVR